MDTYYTADIEVLSQILRDIQTTYPEATLAEGITVNVHNDEGFPVITIGVE